jgi:adenylylsulfate kinase-like enzyme
MIIEDNAIKYGVIWIMGYSASGKTTVTRKVQSELNKIYEYSCKR